MKTLFVSTDFSAAGNNSVKFAARYSADLASNLVVFHAAHLPFFKPAITEAELLQLKKDTEEAKLKELDLVLSKIYQDLGLKRDAGKVVTAVKIEAFAADAILESCMDYHADIIILGTHGATGLKMLGSITTEIIFKAEIPVLVIPSQSEYKKIETMVYATDLKNTINELKCIVPVASRMNATIEILNLDAGKSGTMPDLEERNLMKQVNYDRIKLVIQKEERGMTLLEQMEQYIDRRKPEILVMFPEERSVFDKIFIRSKTEELAYDAKLPLLTYLKSSVEK
jgi:nucleotide-binding universal stress UspA family protein